jgi:hypothetical protein
MWRYSVSGFYSKTQDSNFKELRSHHAKLSITNITIKSSEEFIQKTTQGWDLANR